MNEIDLLKGFRDDMPEPTTDAWLRARAAIAAAGGAPAAGAAPGKDPRRTRTRWFRPLYALSLAVVAAIAAMAGTLVSQRPAPADVGALSAVRTMVASAIRNNANRIVQTESQITLSNGTVYTKDWWDYPYTAQPGSTALQAGMEWQSGNPITRWSVSFIVPQDDELSAFNDCQLTPEGETIDYTNHTYQQSPPPCITVPMPGMDMFVSTARIIGYPVVDDQKTIEFQSVSKGQTFTFWISTVDDLPLQSQTTEKNWSEREQYKYLQPTAGNKAIFTFNRPAGYTQTVQSVMQHAAS
jgi:hypothetical protein